MTPAASKLSRFGSGYREPAGPPKGWFVKSGAATVHLLDIGAATVYSVDMTTTQTHLIRSLGRCRSCKKAHRVDAATWTFSVRCECGTTVKLAMVHGSHDEHIHCGEKCRNAVGPSCDCSCGGANHGINH